jgi:hypothetical protein
MNPNETLPAKENDKKPCACELLQKQRIAIEVRAELRRRLADAAELRRGRIRVYPN